MMQATLTTDMPENDAPVSRATLQQAIEWQLCMQSGKATEQDRHALQRWLDAHPSHARVWQQLKEIDAAFQPASGKSVRQALLKRSSGRKTRLAGTALALLLTLLSLCAVNRYQPVDQLLADYRTGTGERRTVVLPDQTIVRMNTRSAIDLAFDTQRRAIVLHEGEIEVETSHDDPNETRPFIVLTPDTSLRALGTRFIVRDVDRGEGTRLTVTYSAVAARPATCAAEPQAHCDGERIVREGETVVVRDGKVSEPEQAPADTDAWKDGMLVVENRPLGEVAAELARHRLGYLSVDPRVAQLRITGTLPLDDTDQALLALTAAAPVEIVSATRWWARIQPRPPQQATQTARN